MQAVAAGCDALLVCWSDDKQERAVEALVREADASPAFRARCEEACARGLEARRRSTRSAARRRRPGAPSSEAPSRARSRRRWSGGSRHERLRLRCGARRDLRSRRAAGAARSASSRTAPSSSTRAASRTSARAPARPRVCQLEELGDCVVTPGLVDAHTHAVLGGLAPRGVRRAHGGRATTAPSRARAAASSSTHRAVAAATEDDLAQRSRAAFGAWRRSA